MFSREQLVEWFDLDHISQSPARFDPGKLAWLNAQYLKAANDNRLAGLVEPFLARDGCDTKKGPPLEGVVELLKSRVSTVKELADAAVYFYRRIEPSERLRYKHYTEVSLSASTAVYTRFAEIPWTSENISKTLKLVAEETKLKMPMIAMPLRVMVTGAEQTPSIDATFHLIGREEVRRRIEEELKRASERNKGSSG